MDRVKRFSEEILAKFRESFTDDFEENKKILANKANVRSKQLRNRIVGRITETVRREKALQEPEATEEPIVTAPQST